MNVFLAPAADERLLRMPKCNLHTHLEGSVRPETFLELAAVQKIELPFDARQVHDYFQVNGSEKTLVDYLDKIMVNYHVLKDATALQRTAFEAAEDAFRDGVVYLELRAGPLVHVQPALPLDMCIESMLAGLHQAEEKYGIVARLIVTALRDHEPQRNEELALAACRYMDQGVVGFDLAGDEAGYPAQLHHRAFAVVREAGLGLTVHAGEASGADSVAYAVQELGARRIGHGVRSIESTNVMELLREHQVLLEVCPTSNVHTGTFPDINRHPVRRLYEHGIPISINDDDPVTSRTQVSNELTLLQNVFGFTEQELGGVQSTALQHSFLRETQVRRRLEARLQAA